MLQTSQVLSRRLCVSCAAVLPFKDSEGGTWPLQLSDFQKDLHLQARAGEKGFAVRRSFPGICPSTTIGPAISEAAEPRLRYGQRNQTAGYLSLV